MPLSNNPIYRFDKEKRTEINPKVKMLCTWAINKSHKPVTYLQNCSEEMVHSFIDEQICLYLLFSGALPVDLERLLIVLQNRKTKLLH